MGVVFCVDDQNSIVFFKHDIRLHNRQHIAEIIVELPRDLRCADGQFRMFLAEIFQNKLLIQAVHTLFIEEIHQLGCAVRLCLQQALQNQIANRNQHTVRLIIAVIAQIPVDTVNRQRLNIAQEHQQLFHFLFAALVNVRHHQAQNCRLDDTIHIGVFGKLVVGAHNLPLDNGICFQRFRNFHFTTQRRQRFTLRDIILHQTTLELL